MNRNCTTPGLHRFVDYCNLKSFFYSATKVTINNLNLWNDQSKMNQIPNPVTCYKFFFNKLSLKTFLSIFVDPIEFRMMLNVFYTRYIKRK